MKGGTVCCTSVFVVGVKSDNPIDITKQCDSYQRKTDGISHFDDFVADRKTPFVVQAPKRLLTKEPLVAPKELTITKKRVETLRVMCGNGQFHLS